jgi:hypothetical protein
LLWFTEFGAMESHFGASISGQPTGSEQVKNDNFEEGCSVQLFFIDFSYFIFQP